MKSVTFLAGLLALVFLLHLPGLESPLYEDEVGWSYVMHLQNPFAEGVFIIPHPPLLFLVLQGFVSLFGYELRLFFLLVTLANTVMIFLIARGLYDDQTGRWSAAFFSLLFYPFITSLLIEIDVFFLLVSLITVFSYLKYKREETTTSIFMFGLSLGLLLLTRYNGIFLFPVFALDFFLERKKIRLIHFFPYLLAGVIFSIFPLYGFLAGADYFAVTISHLAEFGQATGELPFGAGFVIFFLWSTPLLFFGCLLRVSHAKEDRFVLLWVGIFFLETVLLIKKGDYSRYLLLVVPGISMLISRALLSVFEKRRFILFSLISFSFFLVLSQIFSFHIIPHTIGSYVSAVLSGDFFFLFPLAIDHGPWTAVPFMFILVSNAIALLTFVLAFWTKKRTFLLLFFSFGVGYNAFLVLDSIVPVTHPAYDILANEVIRTARAMSEQNEVYATNKGLLHGVDRLYSHYTFKNAYNQSLPKPERAMKRLDSLEDFETLEAGALILFVDFTVPYDASKIKWENCILIIERMWSTQKAAVLARC